MKSIQYMSNSCSNEYRFAFNGQEKDQEIYNNQSTTTATFWEYDGRIGRRWNRDPKPTVGISDYAVMRNNPIWFNDPMGDVAGWVKDKGTGDKTWDSKINTQEEFDKSTYDKSQYSYEGQTLEIPGYGTIKEPKYTDVVDRQLGESTPFGNIMGPQIELKFSPSDQNSQARWAQSISTNIGNEEQFDPNSKLNLTEFVDPIRRRFKKDDPHFYAPEYNSDAPEYWNRFRLMNLTFYDWPGRSQHPEGTVYFKAETSLLVNTNDGYVKATTFQWGYEMHKNGTSTLNSLKVISSPSLYHNTLIDGLKSVKP